MNPVAHDSPTESVVDSDPMIIENKAMEPRTARFRQTHRSRPGVSKFERWLLRRVLLRLGNPPLAIRLWNGESIVPVGVAPTMAIRIDGRRTLWKIIGDPRFQFGEAYVDRRIVIEGDVVQFLLAVNRALLESGDLHFGIKGISRWLHKPHRTSISQARENIAHHYDIGNDFYRLWLDEQLLYTCAYFAEPTMSLEQAQVAKMDHVCRKVWLRPQDTVIEAGCGWGALALHMARQYGARVRAFNTSHEQILYARERARREGLDDRVEFVEDDWRNITGSCDVFMSVGMLEHVGRENYELLGEVAQRTLTPTGRGLIHSIGRNRPLPIDPWIERRIFPGAYPPAIGEIMDIFEPHGLSVLDVENLRLHYAQTLEHWLSRFEHESRRVAAMFDERFVRTWRLYLAGSMAAFESGNLQLFQFTFAPGLNHNVPRTRVHQYAGPGASPVLFGTNGKPPS